MRSSRSVLWKGLRIAVVTIGAGLLMWLTEARFFGSGHDIVQAYGFLGMLIGLVIALGFSAYLWCKERQEEEELNAKYERNDGDF
jgi:hypothetical protein